MLRGGKKGVDDSVFAPAEPYGLLRTGTPMPSSFIQTLRGLSVAGLLLSAVTIWVAIHGEYDTARWEGIELALCAAAANVCGLTAALLGPKRLRNALICQLILSLISVNLAIEFRASAARGRVVDCAIAESFVRLHHLEHAVHKHDENAVTMALYTRLGELDDMLDLTKQAVGVGSKADRHIESLRHMDEQYIMRKVQDLHKHALDVTEHLRRVELDKNSTATDAENAREARAEAQAVSEYADRLADITEWLGAAAKGKDTVPNTEEYQQILDVLLEAVQQYPHAHAQQRLGREAVEAPWVKASLGRAIENKYSSHHTQHQQGLLETLDGMRKASREEFESFFGAHIDGDAALQGHHGRIIADMPARCVRETRSAGSASLVAWASLAASALEMWIVGAALLNAAKSD